MDQNVTDQKTWLVPIVGILPHSIHCTGSNENRLKGLEDMKDCKKLVIPLKHIVPCVFHWVMCVSHLVLPHSVNIIPTIVHVKSHHVQRSSRCLFPFQGSSKSGDSVKPQKTANRLQWCQLRLVLWSLHHHYRICRRTRPSSKEVWTKRIPIPWSLLQIY